MLEAAKAAGVTSIVCTPHCRDPYFDYDAMWNALMICRNMPMASPQQWASGQHSSSLSLGLKNGAPYLCFDGSNGVFARTRSACRGAGLRRRRTNDLRYLRGWVIRLRLPILTYRAIQRDPDIAERLVRMGRPFRRRLQILWAEGDLARKKSLPRNSLSVICTGISPVTRISPSITNTLRGRLINSHAAEHILRYK